MTQHYCLGFCTTPDGKVLMAIKKEGSDGGAGLNGVGGKVEPDETPIGAMHREWAEETGLVSQEWAPRGSFSGPGWTVHVFHAERFSTCQPQGDQVCSWFHISELFSAAGRNGCTSWATVALAMALETEASERTMLETGL